MPQLRPREPYSILKSIILCFLLSFGFQMSVCVVLNNNFIFVGVFENLTVMQDVHCLIVDSQTKRLAQNTVLS